MTESNSEPLNRASSVQTRVQVRVIDELDFTDLEKTREIWQYLIFSYGSVCLSIEGSPETLNTFAERIKRDLTFVENMLKRASDKSEQ